MHFTDALDAAMRTRFCTGWPPADRPGEGAGEGLAPASCMDLHDVFPFALHLALRWRPGRPRAGPGLRGVQVGPH